MVKFQVHAAADVLKFEHGASPGGASDGHMDWVGTEFWVAGEKSVAASEENGGVAVVHGLDVEDGGGRKVVEKDSAFDFGLDDGVVHVVGEIGVRSEHGAAWIRVMGFGGGGKGCLQLCGNLGSRNFRRRRPGLKAPVLVDSLRGAEALLFHGCAGIPDNANSGMVPAVGGQECPPPQTMPQASPRLLALGGGLVGVGANGVARKD